MRRHECYATERGIYEILCTRKFAVYPRRSKLKDQGFADQSLFQADARNGTLQTVNKNSFARRVGAL